VGVRFARRNLSPTAAWGRSLRQVAARLLAYDEIDRDRRESCC
jgi:hypothetical protein